MSVPDSRAHASPVTSGYPCCNNLLAQVTRFNSTKLVFTATREASLSLRPEPTALGPDQNESAERSAQPLTFAGCRSALILPRASISTAGVAEGGWEEVAFMEDVGDGWRAAPSKHPPKALAPISSSLQVVALFFFAQFFLRYQLIIVAPAIKDSQIRA